MKRITRNQVGILKWLVIILLHFPVAAQQDDGYYPDDEISEDVKYFENKDNRVPRLYKRGNIPSAKLKEWKEDKDFWYANKDFPKKDMPALEPTGRKPYVPLARRAWFQTLLWLFIIGGFAGVLVWFLSEKRVGLFNKKNRPLDAAMEEDIPEDIFSINYQKEIDRAVAQENYRLAVRLMFLRLLSKMSERNIIRYSQDKTNMDYLFELQSTNYYTPFFRIARNYEYSWYGQFEVSRDAFGVIRKDYDQFEKMFYR